ncbi:AbrB/MazE/SpoVT family DNA-binding domain-containing protein [Telmatobacter bradus]|uniref:AbrB/MazE/SpoVT family DNA-binding domain-containing protein n=1 Tax=Telmatobacter bradus TaxID=474953 RepID=UPI003B439FB0
MEEIYSTVSSKGQLVIPAAIREKLGIHPGTRVAMKVEGGQIVLNPQSVEAKLRLIDQLCGITGGGGCEMLLEERRLENERQLREDGW